MSLKSILNIIEQGVKFAEGLAPELALIPGAGPIVATAVKAAGAIADVVDNLQTRIADGTIVAHSTDEAELKDYAQRLAAVNDGLAAQIDAS